MNNVVLIEFKKKKDRAGYTEGTGNINWKAVRNPGLPRPLYLSSVPVYLKLLPMITNFLCSSGYMLECGYIIVYMLYFLPPCSNEYLVFEARFQIRRQENTAGSPRSSCPPVAQSHG